MTTEGETLSLAVEEGVLVEVPSDADGPFSGPYPTVRTWVAILRRGDKGYRFQREWFTRDGDVGGYGIPKNLAPGDVVEFGADKVSPQAPPVTRQDTVNDFEELIRQESRVRRRFYAVVLAIHPTSLELLPCPNPRAAFRAAQKLLFDMAQRRKGLDPNKLRSFLEAVGRGDLTALCILCDWLEEHSDPRGDGLRRLLCGTALELFKGEGKNA